MRPSGSMLAFVQQIKGSTQALIIHMPVVRPSALTHKPSNKQDNSA